MTDEELKPYPCCDQMRGPCWINGRYCRPVCDVHGYQKEPVQTPEFVVPQATPPMTDEELIALYHLAHCRRV